MPGTIDRCFPSRRAPAARPRHAALRAPTSYSDSSLRVDVANGVIYNAALMTEGVARGHPFDIDRITVEQLIAFVNASADGIKSRFRHPAIQTGTDADGNPVQRIADDTGTQVARIKNARMIDANGAAQARGDIYLGDYAADVPGQGDVRGYLLKFAQTDPAGIGMSAFFPYEIDPQLDAYGNVIARPARLLGLDAIDFVGTPAANPRGLLSAGQLFSPQPPDRAPYSSGYSDPDPRNTAAAPLPVSTPDDDDWDEVFDSMSDDGVELALALSLAASSSTDLELPRSMASQINGVLKSLMPAQNRLIYQKARYGDPAVAAQAQAEFAYRQSDRSPAAKIKRVLRGMSAEALGLLCDAARLNIEDPTGELSASDQHLVRGIMGRMTKTQRKYLKAVDVGARSIGEAAHAERQRRQEEAIS